MKRGITTQLAAIGSRLTSTINHSGVLSSIAQNPSHQTAVKAIAGARNAEAASERINWLDH